MSSGGARQRKGQTKKSDGLVEKSAQREGLSETEAVKKASNGWIRAFLIALTVALLFPIVLLMAIPSPIDPQPIELKEPPEMVGPLAPNDILAHAEIIFKGKLAGAESIVVDGDHIYTGTADGWVTHIHKGEIEKLVRFGTGKCGGFENEKTCGRPLGMRMKDNGLLIVADGYFGLYEVNPVTRDVAMLYSSSTPIAGKTPTLLNDLDLGADGKIYLTETSRKFGRKDFLKILMEGAPTGRLLMYDPATSEMTQLFEGLVFANGVQFTKDKSALLIVETMLARIVKYDLKTKQVSIWADNLPGFPDNIRYSKSSGTYWVGLAIMRAKDKFSLLDFLASRPWLRNIVAKIGTVDLFNFVRKRITHTSPAAMVLELNEDGKIVRSLQSRSSDRFREISEVESSDGVLYFGSFQADFIGRLYTKRVPGY